MFAIGLGIPQGATLRISIRELVAALLALLIFSFGGIIWTNRTTANAEIVSSMQSILSNVSSGTTSRSQDFLAEARASSEIAAAMLTQRSIETSEEMESYFGAVLRESPSANGMFYGATNGDFFFVSRSSDADSFRTKLITNEDGRTVELIDRGVDFAVIEESVDPTDTYDPRVRTWYEAASEQETTILTDPYVFFTSQRPGITTASPVYGPDGQLTGVVGVDVELSMLSTFLGELSLGDNGAAFIFNTQGEVIALEDLSMLRRTTDEGFRLTSVDELDSPILDSAYRASINIGNTPRTFTSDVDGATLHAFVAPIEQTDWILGVALAEEDFLGAVRAEQLRSNLIALALGLIGVAVGWRLIQNVTGPLKELRDRAFDIEAGNLVEQDPSTAVINELRVTSDAFDHMVSGLLQQRQENEDLLADMKRRTKRNIVLDRTIDLTDKRREADVEAEPDRG